MDRSAMPEDVGAMPSDQVGEITGSIQRECDRLRDIGALLSEGLQRCHSTERLHPCLERALRELVTHERELAGPEGAHQRLMVAVPGLYGRLRLLQTEHGALTRDARELVEACRTSDDPEEAEALRRRLEVLMGRIERHRQTTLQVIGAAQATTA